VDRRRLDDWGASATSKLVVSACQPLDRKWPRAFLRPLPTRQDGRRALATASLASEAAPENISRGVRAPSDDERRQSDGDAPLARVAVEPKPTGAFAHASQAHGLASWVALTARLRQVLARNVPSRHRYADFNTGRPGRLNSSTTLREPHARHFRRPSSIERVEVETHCGLAFADRLQALAAARAQRAVIACRCRGLRQGFRSLHRPFIFCSHGPTG
jgi:hypothetical protein